MRGTFKSGIKQSCPEGRTGRGGRRPLRRRPEMKKGELAVESCAVETACLRLWVNCEQKIVSFHQLAGYEKLEFTQKEHFLSYVTGLAGRGFLFM